MSDRYHHGPVTRNPGLDRAELYGEPCTDEDCTRDHFVPDAPVTFEGFVKHEGLMTGDGCESPTIDLVLLDNTDTVTKNRKILLVECGDIQCTFEFPLDAAVRNPDGMQKITAALVDFVHGAL